MKPIIQAMAALSAGQTSFALATVTTRNGSAPRSAGAKMLVNPDGQIVGTVGGGMLEAQVQQLAARMLTERRATIQAFQFDGKDAAAMDAICGGQVDVLVEYLDPADAHTAAIIQGLQSAITQHRKAWLVTIFPDGAASTTHALVQSDGTLLGDLPGALTLEQIMDTRLPGRIDLERQQIMIEPVNIAGTAYIYGAGHVSRSLADFVKAVGFWTVVIDDRGEYANAERFPQADEIVILDSFSNALGKISIDRDSYIVIVTRGHLNDLTVLAQVLRCPAGYIGMIGSRRKCGLIFEELRRMGFSEEDLQRVHAPIGISIAAETPEEIGISIAAEMIQSRAAQLKTDRSQLKSSPA
jgi:xanthine dehydrogenase accessory factor